MRYGPSDTSIMAEQGPPVPLIPTPYLNALNNGAFAVVLVLMFLGWFGWQSLVKPVLSFLAEYLRQQQRVVDQQVQALEALKDGLNEHNTLQIGTLDKLGAALEHRDRDLDAALERLARGQQEIKDTLRDRLRRFF